MKDQYEKRENGPGNANHEYKHVLIVDDIESIRIAISDFLKTKYKVSTAQDGRAALKVLQKEPVDMVLTDIRMPVMGGLELIENVQKEYPGTQYALMTAYNINDYVAYAREKHIWNIIPKTMSLDLKFIETMVEKLLTGNIFGIELYYPSIEIKNINLATLHKVKKERSLDDGQILRISVSSQEQRDLICETLAILLIEYGAPSSIRQIIEELSSNAMFQVLKSRSEDEFFDISAGIIGKNVLISVTDPFGALDRDEILYRLERHTTIDESGLPVGISDDHGRGLFISRENLDQLVFNIDPGKKTEVIGILFLDGEVRSRAVSIYQKASE